MKKVMKKIGNRRGGGNLLAIVLVLAIMLIASVVWEYTRLMIVATGVRDALQSAIISVSTTNYDEVYNGLREGYSGGYMLDGERWDEALDTGDIYHQLDSTLGLNQTGGRHVKYAGDVLEYGVWGLNVEIVNAPFARSSYGAGDQFLAKAEIELEVPLSFGWGFLPPMRAVLHVEAGYTPKF